MAYELLNYEKTGRVVHITLNRPERLNAFSVQLVHEIDDAFEQFDQDDDSWVAIIRGNGRCFSAGADVQSQAALLRAGKVHELHRTMGSRKPRGFLDCFNWKPVIAAVHGYCFGIALQIVLDCDIVCVAEDARFRVAEVQRGLGAGYLAVRLAQAGCGRVGTELGLTGRDLMGVEAHRLGFAARLAKSQEELREAADAVAAQILQHPPLGVRANVRVARLARLQETASLAFAHDDVGRLSKTEDYELATKAFFEKRPAPPFTAR